MIKDMFPEPLPQPEPKSEPVDKSTPKPKPEPKPEPEPGVEGEKSIAKRRSAKADAASFGVTSSPDIDVTVQTSVTYQVSTKQGRSIYRIISRHYFPERKYWSIAKCLCDRVSQEVVML